jgi:hypothetical protein
VQRPRIWFETVPQHQHKNVAFHPRVVRLIENGVAFPSNSLLAAKQRIALALGRICPEKASLGARCLQGRRYVVQTRGRGQSTPGTSAVLRLGNRTAIRWIAIVDCCDLWNIEMEASSERRSWSPPASCWKPAFVGRARSGDCWHTGGGLPACATAILLNGFIPRSQSSKEATRQQMLTLINCVGGDLK